MEQLQAFLKKHKHWFILPAILLFLLAAMVWVNYSIIRPAAQEVRVTPVNLAGNDKTAVLNDGEPFIQKVEFDDTIQGVLFTVVNFHQVVTGTMQVEIADADGTVLASAEVLLQEFLNETPRKILLNTLLPPPEKGGAYYLRITPHYEQMSQGIALLKDGKAKGTLEINGGTEKGLLVYSIITEQSGNFIHTYFAVVCALLLAGVILAYLFCFILKVKIHVAFFSLCVLFGICYSLVLPPHIAPDEEVHIATAYSYTSPLFGQPVRDEAGMLMVRKSDLAYQYDASTFTVFTYKTVARDIFGKVADATPTPSKRRTASVFPISYLPITIGVFLARLFGFNYVTMVLFARFFNLLAFAGLWAFAVYIMPAFGKKILLVCGLLPMTMHLAASCSYDAYVLAMAAVYISYCLHLYSKPKEAFTRKNWITLVVLAALLAPAKAIYVFICGVCLLLPLSKFASKQKRRLVMGTVLLAAAVSFGMFNFTALRWLAIMNTAQAESQAAEQQVQPAAASQEASAAALAVSLGGGDASSQSVGESASALPEGESDALPEEEKQVESEPQSQPPEEVEIDYVPKVFFTPSYILGNLAKTVKVSINTIQENTLYYLRQLVGGHLGEPILRNIEINGIFIGLFYGLLGLSTLNTKKQLSVLSKRNKLLTGFLVLCTLGALYVTVLTWTPADYSTLWGMQGRYVLPVLPLLLLLAQGDWAVLKKEIERPLIFAAAFLHVFVVLNVFQQAFLYR